MANKRKALEGHCLDLGYKFKVARRYLDTRTLNSLSVLEKLWRSKKQKASPAPLEGAGGGFCFLLPVVLFVFVA